jgi:magnesium chelatase family protein
MAHNGVLFLDEAPEFQQPALEALRQPLESGEVIIHRSAGMARFPSAFQLILASNPCPCGNLLSRHKSCTCTAAARGRYENKLSGPLLDRIDIQLNIAAANPAQIAMSKKVADSDRETSARVREKVFQARMLAAERLVGTPWKINSQIAGPYLRRKLKPAPSITAVLDRALDLGRISMRGYDRCLRLAWTSADFDGRSSVSKDDLDFALFLRGGQTAGESF